MPLLVYFLKPVWLCIFGKLLDMGEYNKTQEMHYIQKLTYLNKSFIE